jgi:hypothetical protein
MNTFSVISMSRVPFAAGSAGSAGSQPGAGSQPAAATQPDAATAARPSRAKAAFSVVKATAVGAGAGAVSSLAGPLGGVGLGALTFGAVGATRGGVAGWRMGSDTDNDTLQLAGGMLGAMAGAGIGGLGGAAKGIVIGLVGGTFGPIVGAAVGAAVEGTEAAVRNRQALFG